MVAVVYNIALEKALAEYMQDADLREVIQSGNFLYIENSFVMDKPKYVCHNENREPFLTDYARLNINECALPFEQITYSVLPSAKRGESNGDYPDVLSEIETKYLANRASWIKSAIKEADRASSAEKTFWSYLEDIFVKNNSNAEDFEARTLLDKSTYYKYMNKEGRPNTIGVPTIMAIAVGYDLTLHETEGLMQSIGLSFIPASREHSIYKFILTLRAWSIYERNNVLVMAGVKRLGSQARESNSKKH